MYGGKPFSIPGSYHHIFLIIFLQVCDVTTRQSTIAVIGQHDSLTMEAVTEFAKVFQIPYVTSSPVRHLTTEDYVISLNPDLSPAIVDLLQFVHWTQVHYIYDTDQGKYIN